MSLKRYKTTTSSQIQLINIDRSSLWNRKSLRKLWSAFIALVKYIDNEYKYIIAPDSLKAGNKIISADKAKSKVGKCMKLRNIIFIRLPSGEQRLVNGLGMATIGVV